MRLHPRRLRATGIAAISLLCLMVRAPPHHRCHFPPSDGLLQGTVSYFSAFMSTSPEQAHWDAPSLNRRDQLVEQQLQAVSVNWGAADANMKVCCRAPPELWKRDHGIPPPTRAACRFWLHGIGCNGPKRCWQ